MFKRTMIAASLAVAALASGQSMAAVVGGGSSLAYNLYTTPGVLTAGFDTYSSVGSGNGKAGFLNNDVSKINSAAKSWPAGTTVDYAGSDSVLSQAELTAYNTVTDANGLTNAQKWGPLIQVPSAITSVTVPYKLTLANGTAVTDLNLTTAQLCSIFSGTTTSWDQIDAAYPATPIKVFYRDGSSGTSEIFTRHLNTQCGAQITVSSTFANAVVGGVPANATAVALSPDMAKAATTTEGGIGYVGPEDVDATNNAVVARVNGILPTVGNVQTALSTIAPPTGADVTDPSKWAPVLPAPASGYPIIAYTNLIFGQCYQDATEAGQVRTFLNRHYGNFVNNDAAITAQKLIPLNTAWKNAVRNTFAVTSSAQSINDANTCNGIGRPL